MCIVSISSVPYVVTNWNIRGCSPDALMFACLYVSGLSYLAY